MKKGLVIGLVLGMLIGISPVMASQILKVYVNGNYIGDGTVISGSTYVPLRKVAEVFNKDVSFDKANGVVNINDLGIPQQEVKEVSQTEELIELVQIEKQYFGTKYEYGMSSTGEIDIIRMSDYTHILTIPKSARINDRSVTIDYFNNNILPLLQ